MGWIILFQFSSFINKSRFFDDQIASTEIYIFILRLATQILIEILRWWVYITLVRCTVYMFPGSNTSLIIPSCIHLNGSKLILSYCLRFIVFSCCCKILSGWKSNRFFFFFFNNFHLVITKS